MNKAEEQLKRDTRFLKGTKVILEDIGTGCTVYPISPRHLPRFGKDLSVALGAVISIGNKGALTEAQFAGQVLQQLVPFVMENLLDAVEDCTVMDDPEMVSFDDLAHYHVAAGAAWRS